MAEGIKPNYDALSPAAYTSRINTPAKNPLYHHQFHHPLVEEARRSSSTPTIVDVASGHADELSPIVEEDPNVRLVAVDLARNTLVNSTRGRIRARTLLTLSPSSQGSSEELSDGFSEIIVVTPEDLQRELIRALARGNVLVAADVRNMTTLKPGFADAGIALNAMVYEPLAMLKALRACLKPGAPASVNFRNSSNPYNNPFYQFYLDDGGEIQDGEIEVGGRKLATRVLDYRNCGDKTIRALDRQTYLTNIDDMRTLIESARFQIERQQPFHFASPSNPDNEIDVFSLRAV